MNWTEAYLLADMEAEEMMRAEETADRIKQLVAANEAQAAEIERLRGDLAKAVEALERVSNSQPRPKRNGDYDRSDVSALQRIARTAIAVLTGGKP